MLNRIFKSISNGINTITGNKYYQAVITFMRYMFLPLLIIYLMLLIIDAVSLDSISGAINLDYFLIPIIFTGIIAVLTGFEKERKVGWNRLVKGDIVPIICCGIVGGAIVWYQTREVGWLTYVISPVCGIVIVLLTLFIWQNPEGDKGEDFNSPNN